MLLEATHAITLYIMGRPCSTPLAASVLKRARVLFPNSGVGIARQGQMAYHEHSHVLVLSQQE